MDFNQIFPPILLNKLSTIDCEFHFVQAKGKVRDLNNSEIDVDYDYSQIQFAWNLIQGVGRSNPEIWLSAWSVVNSFGEKIVESDDSTFQLIRKLKGNHQKDIYFVLTDFRNYIPAYGLNILVNIFQINNGSYPVHACGIIRNSSLFLFCGVSGAGKSTVSTLSQSIGAEILDEDGVLIHRLFDNRYSADAWSYSSKKFKLPIRAVFSLIKDSTDSLTRLSAIKLTEILFQRAMDFNGKIISTQIYKKVFSGVSDFARSIPGYELHFRKSPDFWKLIDAEFGLD